MRFGILGRVLLVSADGRTLPVGGARLRALYALLLADAGRIVPTSRLIDGAYGSDPPAGASAGTPISTGSTACSTRTGWAR